MNGDSRNKWGAHKPLGKAKRVGLSLAEFFRLFPDDAAAEGFFEAVRWPDGPICPRCDSKRVVRMRLRKPMPLRCRDCRRFFSVRHNTVMGNSKLGAQTWLLGFYLLMTGLKGISSLKLGRDLGVTQKTAWFLSHRIREAMRENDPLFAKVAEADETYVGGVERNKHQHKRMKAAGGPAGKSIVAGVRDRQTGKVAARPVPDTGSTTLIGMVTAQTVKGARVFTDEAPGYLPLTKMGFDHQSVKHSVSKYVDGMAHTNGLESFWATLKRGYQGIYHQMSRYHLPRYVDEFAARHNLRRNDTIAQLAEVTCRMVGRTLTWRQLTGNGCWAQKARSVP